MAHIDVVLIRCPRCKKDVLATWVNLSINTCYHGYTCDKCHYYWTVEFKDVFDKENGTFVIERIDSSEGEKERGIDVQVDFLDNYKRVVELLEEGLEIVIEGGHDGNQDEGFCTDCDWVDTVRELLGLTVKERDDG